MQITQQQMQMFEEVQLQRFEDEVMAGLRQSFGEMIATHRLDDAGLRAIVGEATRRAATYGIVGESDVTRFVEFVFEYGGGFEQLAWAAPVLRSLELTGDEKVDRLGSISTFEVR